MIVLCTQSMLVEYGTKGLYLGVKECGSVMYSICMLGVQGRIREFLNTCGIYGYSEKFSHS